MNNIIKKLRQQISDMEKEGKTGDTYLLLIEAADLLECKDSDLCTCAKNDFVDLIMFCSNCGGKVPQSK